MTKTFLKTLSKLVNIHKTASNLAVSDFVNNFFNQEEQVEQKEVIKAFLGFVKHENFLEDVAKMFLKECKLYSTNIENVKIQIYFIMFLLDSEKIEDILNHSQYYTKDLIQFLSTQKYLTVIARKGCKYFENIYILREVVEPFQEKRELVDSVINKIKNRHFIKSPRKKITVPVEFDFSKKYKSPPPPVNTPTDFRSFQAARPPRTTKHPEVKVLQKIEESYQENKIKAQKLLEETSKIPKRLTDPKKSVQIVEPKFSKIQLKKVPPKKDVPIKENLTTTLREAARLMKQQEQEIKIIEDVIRGGCSSQNVEKLESEHRKNQELQSLENIQRKRLEGLISYEEAIIAKKKLLDENRRKVEEFKIARAEMLQELEDWRNEEQRKIKEAVEKCHKSKKDMKAVERQTIEEKQNQVRMLQNKTREMLQRAYEERIRELTKKVELIREIKAIHEISMRINAKREFDRTETQNLGLLCEMSIAELQERLVLAKLQIKEKLDAKRQQILDRKAKQQETIENVKNFVAQHRRMSKTKTVPIRSPKLERSPSLLQLEKVLFEKRSLRMKIT